MIGLKWLDSGWLSGIAFVCLIPLPHLAQGDCFVWCDGIDGLLDSGWVGGIPRAAGEEGMDMNRDRTVLSSIDPIHPQPTPPQNTNQSSPNPQPTPPTQPPPKPKTVQSHNPLPPPNKKKTKHFVHTSRLTIPPTHNPPHPNKKQQQNSSSPSRRATPPSGSTTLAAPTRAWSLRTCPSTRRGLVRRDDLILIGVYMCMF